MNVATTVQIMQPKAEDVPFFHIFGDNERVLFNYLFNYRHICTIFQCHNDDDD